MNLKARFFFRRLSQRIKDWIRYSGKPTRFFPRYSFLQNGRFVILKLLGHGTEGNAYLAERTADGCLVVVKEFYYAKNCTRDKRHAVMVKQKPEDVEKMRKNHLFEASLLSELNHPNIVKVKENEIFDENNTSYFVMDYIEGVSLMKLVREKGALPQELSFYYISRIADALSYLHHNNIMHGDLSPSNIIIRKSDNQPILIDFGNAAKINKTFTDDNPEKKMLACQFGPMDQRGAKRKESFVPSTDIYSLAATLYYMLIGTPPPISYTVVESGLPPMPDHVSPVVAYAITKGMQPRRKDRPASVEDFMALLCADTIPAKPEMPESYVNATPNEDYSPETQMFDVEGISFKMIKVDGAEFVMGATKEQNEAFPDEYPAHIVKVDEFWLAETVVTQQLWQTVMKDNPSNKKSAIIPVVNVSWNDCQVFIEKLNSLIGADFRLPTEAEWEFAARGGICSHGLKYAGSDDIDQVGWYWRNCGQWPLQGEWESSKVASCCSIRDVKTKQPNELGLYDMSGNIGEWCQDDFKAYGSDGTGSDGIKVFRGGAWNGFSRYCRVSCRFEGNTDDINPALGLRLAL